MTRPDSSTGQSRSRRPRRSRLGERCDRLRLKVARFIGTLHRRALLVLILGIPLLGIAVVSSPPHLWVSAQQDGQQGGSTVPIAPPSPPARPSATSPPPEPTTAPTVEPTDEPTVEPSLQPTVPNTVRPTVEPTQEPPDRPTPVGPTPGDPTSGPPTGVPTTEPEQPGGAVDGAQATWSLTLDRSALFLNLTTVESDAGNPIRVSPAAIRIEGSGLEPQRVVLPLVLLAGQQVTAFNDRESGISWRPFADSTGGLLTLPLRGGGSKGRLSLQLGPLEGDGRDARATVRDVEVVVDFSDVETTGSSGGVAFSAALRHVPSVMDITVTGRSADSSLMLVLERAASQLGADRVEVGLAVELKTSFAPSVLTAEIVLAIDAGWVDRWQAGRVRIARVGDDQAASILETVSAADGPSGQVRFQAESEEGLSTFALVALLDDPGSSPLLWAGIGGALTTAGALAGWLLWRRRVRQAGASPLSD